MQVRRGYQVDFSVTKDEKDRPFATDVKLTAEGRVAAVEREATIAGTKVEVKEGKENKEVNKESAAPRQKKERKPRVLDERTVSLVVSAQGKSDFQVVAQLSQSIGKLKFSCVEGLGVPTDYNIYCDRSSANPKGIMLTKALLRNMKDGDKIFMVPPEVEKVVA